MTDVILDLTDRGEVVLDPFLGSGSTLIAAHGTGRRCFGIELDPKYVDVAIRRFQAVYGGSVVLESTGETFDVVAQSRQQEENSTQKSGYTNGKERQVPVDKS